MTVEVGFVDPVVSRSGLRSWVELTKPRIIELLLITTVPAMFVAAQGWPGLGLILATLVGGTLSAAGANVINQVIDRDIDRLMRRTRGRPIPTGRITPRGALIFGIVLGVAGFVLLWATTNLLAAALSTAGLLFYVFVYSIALKRRSSQNIVIGGAAGAVPALVGWAAVRSELDLAAWIMFAIVFVWTPPHFWALSLRYRDDYAAAGVPMLPVVDGVPATLDQIVSYTAALVGVSLLLFAVGAVGALYLVVALAAGIWLTKIALDLRKRPGLAMRFFIATNLYLAVVFVAMAVDVMVG